MKGDVIVIEFPFSNLKELKRRPVLVIKVPKGDDFIALQITGSSYEKDVEILIRGSDFSDGQLKRDSFVRIDKIGSIERSLVKYKIGSLKEQKFKDILNNFINYIEN